MADLPRPDPIGAWEKLADRTWLCHMSSVGFYVYTEIGDETYYITKDSILCDNCKNGWFITPDEAKKAFYKYSKSKTPDPEPISDSVLDDSWWEEREI